jgi:hypothetical protein
MMTRFGKATGIDGDTWGLFSEGGRGSKKKWNTVGGG